VAAAGHSRAARPRAAAAPNRAGRVGTRYGPLPESSERITKDQALAATGGAAVAHFDCRPDAIARRNGCAELMETLVRLSLGLAEGADVKLLSGPPKKGCAIL